MPPSSATVVGLVLWGAIVAVDLVSFPQALLARPLVAGTGAGLLLGDIEGGLRLGMVLELFALDVLPVGASRYPDYGPGVGAGLLLLTGRPWVESLGIAALFALGWAVVGGWSLEVLRRFNGRELARHAAGLAAGDAATMARLQHTGLAADLLRGTLLSAAGVGVALLLAPHVPVRPAFSLVTAVAVGAAVAAAAGGAIRSAGRGQRLRWLAAGAGTGLLLAALR